MGRLLTYREAQDAILARVERRAAAPVPLADALGRVTAEPAAAAVDLPPFDSSAMDGYAVRSADTPGTLRVGFDIAAGGPAGESLAAGEAMVISTGGVVPQGADAVVPIENAVRDGDAVSFAEPARPGAHVRPRGGDIRAGETVVPAGVRLDAARIGALGAAGVATVVCAPRPRIAVLATGTELAPPGTPLAPGQVYEANGLMLAAALRSEGADVEVLPPVADDERAHRAALEHGLTADVLVTSGGVSVGPHDLVRAIEAELGVEEVFWRIAIKPGKPVAFGVRGTTLVFGLPGNPVSSLIACELFVKPAVRALQGLADPLPRFEPGTLASPLRRGDGRDELVRAVAHRDGDTVELHPLTGQESHMIARTAAADALVLVPSGAGEIAAGATVRWLRLG